ncbi:Protein ABHD4 [Portunus trituberculatus]|uniref:Protein ABHD4 n=1 Tax=Portunus trituberculatus TaxID=210409 RepID=A0A5B7CRI8_PORTR|nr:Protein ABHD4 [Portunus trituberculatus]
MAGFGWAKYPMIQRMDSLRKGLPITLIYGARSWVDHDPGFQIKYMRKDTFVDVKVIQGAGHHVYADRAQSFNAIVNNIGHHSDNGTLPQLAPDSEEAEGQVSSRDVAVTLSSMINVRNDNMRDEPIVTTEVNGRQFPITMFNLGSFVSSQLDNIQNIIHFTKKHIDDLNSRFAGFQHPPSLYLTSPLRSVVRAHLPNKQRTTVPVQPGRTLKDALAKALNLRKLSPDVCIVYRKTNPKVRRRRRRRRWCVFV